jgi:hypothetical protein
VASQITQPACGVNDQGPAVLDQRLELYGQRIDGEVSGFEIGLDRERPEVCNIHLSAHASEVQQGASGPTLLVKREPHSPERAGDLTSDRQGIGRHHEVGVHDLLPLQQGVSHQPSCQENLLIT